MKSHTHFHIVNGQVVKCSSFDSLSGAIRANTKAEATALFLARAEEIISNPPHVYVWNGAFLIISHNGHGFVCESGALPANATTPKRLNSSCTSGHFTLAEAMGDKTFAYYASADYQQIRANQLASLKPEAIASAVEAQKLSTAAEG